MFVITLLIRSSTDSPPALNLDYWGNTPLNEQHFIFPGEYVTTYGSSHTGDMEHVGPLYGQQCKLLNLK